MTTAQSPELIKSMSNTALHQLDLMLDYANKAKGFGLVLDLCENLYKEAKKTAPPLGAWATVGWSPITLIESKVPGFLKEHLDGSKEFLVSNQDEAALDELKSVLALAFDNGGFERLVEVCEDFSKRARKSQKASPEIALNMWIHTQWKGLDFMESKVPGCTVNFASKYRD
jgi:hypothetical protein